MEEFKKISDVRNFVFSEKKKGRSVGFVPTMGNLHDGHISLVEEAKKECDLVITSIFVNPLQFGKGEDFQKYPRTFNEDQSKLDNAGNDAIFYPEISEMYPSKDQTILDDTVMANNLCGKFRKGHFSGVLTVVAKLFNIVRPDKAYFGMKDYQQYVLIKNMVESLNMDIEIIGCPIVREKDGLAMSSRNSSLSTEERKKALCLSKAIFKMKESFDNGNNDVHSLKAIGITEITSSMDLQYLEIVDGKNLEPVLYAQKGNLIAAAAYCAKTRLIDNIIL